MGLIKDFYDVASGLPPLKGWLTQIGLAEERKRGLMAFSPDLVKLPEETTRLIDYYKWNEEAATWDIGDGDIHGTSHKELVQTWSTPSIYLPYEAGLIRYVRRGGTVNRLMVVSGEFFDPAYQLLLIRTCLRQTLLGFEPYIAFPSDIGHALGILQADCDMIGIVNNRIGYLIRMNPSPVMMRTTEKRVIGRAWEAHREMSRGAVPFETWLRGCPFASRRHEVIADVEAECSLIHSYAENLR